MIKNKQSCKKHEKKKTSFQLFSKKRLMGLTIAGVMTASLCTITGCSFIQGSAGKNGSDGATWYSGTEYSEKQGAVGDFFFDTDDFNIYKKTDKGWTLISNIKGPQGEVGETGPQGPAGVDGTNGMDGTNGIDGITPTITINEDGYWVINGIPTDTKAQGQDGANGITPTITINEDGYWVINGIPTDTKAQGQDGINGTTPTISINEDGYWVINEEVTDVKAEAIDGTNGQDGATWSVGTEYPINSKANDLFLNNTTWEVYKYDGSNWISQGNIKGQDGTNGTNGIDGTNGTTVILSNSSFMHISFDDVEKCFANLKNNTYTSLYEEPFFNWLKSMHDTYGAKFSLYAYNEALTDVPNTYAEEFFKAKDWLKIGLHADNSSSNFGSATYEEGKSSWNTFVDNIVRITGSYLSVDRMPRLHMFAGSEKALKGMRDANYGAIGFLSADDLRKSYYFDHKTTDYLYDYDHVTDRENGLIFVATDLRADWFAGNSAGNKYKEPTKTSVYDELVERYSNVSYANSIGSYIFFGHEWLIYNGTSLNSGKQYFEDACRFTKDYEISFDYSQNKAFSPTFYDAYTIMPKEETVEYYERTMNVVYNINEMTFNPSYSIGGGASDFNNTVSGRAACITEVLAVYGGETIGFISNLEEVFGETQLFFAVQEFASYPFTRSTLSTDTDEACAKAWMTNSHTFNENTRFVMIAFKNGDGTTDFTDEQAQILSQCLKLS